MTFFLGLLTIVFLLLLAVIAFTRTNPTALANTLRFAGPATLGLVGLVLLLAGRAALGGILLSGAAAWLGSNRIRRSSPSSAGQRSRVRSAALEMELDHDTGGLEGTVLAGHHEGRDLAGLDLDDLLALRNELSGDEESLQLLETYLDSRFPVWRDRADPHYGSGEGATRAAGPMGKEEAYEILGLETGASTAQIRQAHRRLMQRLHPDVGGSALLAARINEARDVLLSDHE